MGFRFRRSVKIGPGVRMNVGKRSMGLSAGGRGFRYSVSTSGRTTRTVGVPGTGASWVSTSTTGGNTRRAGARSRTTSGQRAVPTPSSTPQLKAGFFASAIEKKFVEGVNWYVKDNIERALAAFEDSSSRDTRNLSDDLFAGVCALRLKDNEKALFYMERVVQSDIPLPDQLMLKYLSGASMFITLYVTPRVEAQIPFDNLGAALILAELYQEVGRRDEAIGILQQLAEQAPDDSVLKLSLCDLLYEEGSDDEVIELAAGVENDSEPALACLHLKGKALARRGLHSAAIDTFSVGLRKTSGRNPDLLKEIRYDRATLYDEINQPKSARKDWERLYADDPSYRDVRGRLTGPQDG